MIQKITRGTKMTGLVSYLFGRGRANKHTDPHIVAAYGGLSAQGAPRFRERGQVTALGVELDGPRRLFGTEVAGGHVWHCSLSNHADDRRLSDEEWGEIAREVVERMGFTDVGGKAPCRWVAVRHGLSAAGNDHIHLAVSLVREDGTKASNWNDRRTVARACADFERRYGLQVVEGRSGAGMPGLTRAETEIAQRTGRPEPSRLRLARTVRGCATAAGDEAEFVRRLRGSGVLVRPRYAAGGREAVVGYSVALPPGKGESVVWFGGGRLGADLTLPRLRGQWGTTPAVTADAVEEWRGGRGSGRSAPGREAASFGSESWEQAAKVVAGIRLQLAAVPLDDGASWTGAARDTSGVLAAWSTRIERERPGPLAYAADVLARSAQSREEPRPRRGSARKDFPGVAMVAWQASRGGSGARGQMLLLRQLTRVMEALHDAHQTRGQARQAAALAAVARNQLAQLHSATQQPAASGGVPPLRPPAQRPGHETERG